MSARNVTGQKKNLRQNLISGIKCLGGLKFETTPDGMRVTAIHTTHSGRIDRKDLPKGILRMIKKWEEIKRNLVRHAKTLPKRFWRKKGQR